MTLDLLDLLLILHFCFDKPIPWWFWVLGVLASMAAGVRLNRIEAALKIRG